MISEPYWKGTLTFALPTSLTIPHKKEDENKYGGMGVAFFIPSVSGRGKRDRFSKYPGTRFARSRTLGMWKDW
jgi:hypothetical protein